MIHPTRSSRPRFTLLGRPEDVDKLAATLKAAGAWELDRVPLRDGRLLVQLGVPP